MNEKRASERGTISIVNTNILLYFREKKKQKNNKNNIIVTK